MDGSTCRHADLEQEFRKYRIKDQLINADIQDIELAEAFKSKRKSKESSPSRVSDSVLEGSTCRHVDLEQEFRKDRRIKTDNQDIGF